MSGWGRYPTVHARVTESENLERASATAVISRGLGRAYGDSALPPAGETRSVLVTPRADRVLSWDPQQRILRAEAGMSVAMVRELFLAQGFFLPVSPGTRHVTLGGLVAADVHGKNHHVAGCFGRHVRALKMRVGDGRVLEVTREGEFSDLFFATQGGMGLTGHILEVEFTLEAVPSPWIYEHSERFGSLDEVIAALRDASASWPMTVAWIDTSARGAKTGRGIVAKGRWASADEAPKDPPKVKGAVAVPFDFPNGLVNPSTIGIMNTAWYHLHGSRTKTRVVHPESYFWPLDGINHWNRAFGTRGFTQFQCVLPTGELYRDLLGLFADGGGASFVSVFKDCGEMGEGLMSFPQKGTSLALDLPLRKDGGTQRLYRTLCDYVLDKGGRIYLAKDAFGTAQDIRATYPNLDKWLAVRHKYDPQGNIASAQGQRVGML